MTIDRSRPSYRLEDLRVAIDNQRCVFTKSAREGRAALGFTEEDGNECLKSLSRSEFAKSAPDRAGRKGLFHDQYATCWDGHHIFVKFFRVSDDQPFIVSSFKTDTDYDV
ncbi:MAG: type II toxin-antitoxin system MqsR family toxin [Actinomycetia bacterium]|nr:type II toxin-antitoxin system MqsR family toxin [Actinomycetes bacterium]